MSSNNEEKNLYEKLSESSAIIQYILLFFIMYSLSTILRETFGPMGDNFFCMELNSNGYFTGSNLMNLYLILSFILIVGVREWVTNKRFRGVRRDESVEGFGDLIPYLIITIATFAFAGAYIRQNFSTGTGQSGGGPDGGFDWIDEKIKSTNYGKLTLYIGILLVIVNFFSNVYMYLKNKKTMRKNKIARSIYYAQITNMLLGILTAIFIFGFGCEFYMRGSNFDKGLSVFKVLFVIGIIVYGIRKINVLTNSGDGPENWFGDTIREENMGARQTE